MFYKNKPKVLLLIDKPNWAFDICADGFIPYLSKYYDIKRVYVTDKPNLNNYKFDLLHVFFYAENYYKNFDLKGAKLIKEISSHRWEDTPPYGPKSVEEVNKAYLSDADGIITVSKKLYNIFNKINNSVYFVPNGYDTNKFYRQGTPTGELTFGWAGNINDQVKGFRDLIQPATDNKYKLNIAPGNMVHEEMNNFYKDIDVLLIGSRNEGEPIPLIESMAAGCFPISTDVGISRELIENYVNGIILPERNLHELRAALDWCSNNIESIRKLRTYNSVELLKLRNWDICSSYLKYAYESTLNLKTHK